MTFPEVLSHPFWRAWAETLLHFVWQGTVVGLIAALLLKSRSLRTASQRYAVSLVTLLVMAACVATTFAVVAPTVSVRRAVLLSAESAHSKATALPAADGLQSATTPDAAFIFASMPEPDTICRWVVVAWSLGVVALSLRIVASWIGMRLLARGRQPVPAAIGSTIARLATGLKLRRIPAVFASARVVDATVVGFLKPMVLLPAAWLVELSPDMLEAVLAHELAHIRRHDLWINLVQRVVETMLFYHPAVWWVSRRLRAEREMCCDELAVSITRQRLVYVTALESVARRRAGLVKPALAVTLGDQDMALLKRIRHILGFSAASSSTGWWPAAVVTLALPATLWLGWASFVPGAKAVADEAVATDGSDDTPRSIEKSLGDADDAPRGFAFYVGDDRAEDDRPASPKDREPDGPPNPPPEGRRADDGGGLPHGFGRRGPGRPGDEPRGVRRGFGRARENVDGPGIDGAGRSRDDDDAPGFGAGVRRGPPGLPRDGERRGLRGLRGAHLGPPVGRPDERGEQLPVDSDDGDESDRRVGKRAPQDEMVRLLSELRHEVEQLRREVRELRDQRRPGPGMGREIDRRGPRSDEDRDDIVREPDDGERGTRILPPFKKDRPSGRRPRGGAPFVPEGPIAPDGRRLDGPSRRERPEDDLRDRDPVARPPVAPGKPPVPPNDDID